MFMALLHNVFLLYHIKMFVDVFKISESAFWVGEGIFLLWNSCNDFVFGWMADKSLLVHDNSGTRVPLESLLRRVNMLRRGGLGMAISFMLLWVQILPPALQFPLVLCLYDSFLTTVDLAQNALLADLSDNESERAEMSICNSMFAVVGAATVFSSSLFWDSNDTSNFLAYCLFISAVSAVGFETCSRVLRYYVTREYKAPAHVDSAPPVPDPSPVSWLSFLRQILRNKNFVMFSVLHLIQVFHCHFNSNFFPFFLEAFLGEYLSSSSQGLLLAFSFVMPHINNVLFTRIAQTKGVYDVISGLLLIKFGIALLMLFMGPSSIALLIVFIASNRVFTEGTCRLLSLVISEIVDEDYVQHNRDHSVAALIYGTSAMLSKPGQTIAPLIGTWLITANAQSAIFSHQPVTPRDAAAMKEVLFTMLVYVPIVCASVQLYCWKQYTLKGSYLRQIQAKLRKGRGLEIL